MRALFSERMGQRGWSLDGPAAKSPRQALIERARKAAAERAPPAAPPPTKAAPVASPKPPVPRPGRRTRAERLDEPDLAYRGMRRRTPDFRDRTPPQQPNVHDALKTSPKPVTAKTELEKSTGKSLLTKSDLQQIQRTIDRRQKMGEPMGPGGIRDVIEQREARAQHRIDLQKEFGRMSEIMLKRPSRFSPEVMAMIRSVMGVPGKHRIPLAGKKNRTFTIWNDAKGVTTSWNTKTKSAPAWKKVVSVVGTVLSFVPATAVVARIGMAAMGAIDGIKNGNVMGAIASAVGGVATGVGAALGKAATAAVRLRQVASVAQIASAVKQKDPVALINAAGGAAVDFNLGVDPTKLVAATNLISGARRGNIADVLSTAASYARGNGNFEAANALRAAAVTAGVGIGIKDEDLTQVARHIGMGVTAAQQEQLRRKLEQLEPNRPDATVDGLEPVRVNVKQRLDEIHVTAKKRPTESGSAEEVAPASGIKFDTDGSASPANVGLPTNLAGVREPTVDAAHLPSAGLLDDLPAANEVLQETPTPPEAASEPAVKMTQADLRGLRMGGGRYQIPKVSENVRRMSNDRLLEHLHERVEVQGLINIADVSPMQGIEYWDNGAKGGLLEDLGMALSIPAAGLMPWLATGTLATSAANRVAIKNAEAEIKRRIKSGDIDVRSVPEIEAKYGPIVGALVTMASVAKVSPKVIRTAKDLIKNWRKNDVEVRPADLKELNDIEKARIARRMSDTPEGAAMRREEAIRNSEARIARVDAGIRERIANWKPPTGELGEQLFQLQTAAARARAAGMRIPGYDPIRAMDKIDVPSGRESSRIAGIDELLAPEWTPKGMTQVQAVFDGTHFRVQDGGNIRHLNPREFAIELRSNPALQNNPSPILLRTVADTGIDFKPDGSAPVIPSAKPPTSREIDQMAAVLERPIVRNTGPHVDADLDGNLLVADYQRNLTGGWTVHVPDRVEAPVRTGGSPHVVPLHRPR